MKKTVLVQGLRELRDEFLAKMQGCPQPGRSRLLYRARAVDQIIQIIEGQEVTP